ncbi:hypothetical protein [Pantoea agglomerans]|uniref:hypothetical protein n=1 Tax=Enterobacter agglomerans TaxID=549 RepID=UPI003C7C52DB
MKIARIHELNLVNYLKSPPFYAMETRIDHGIKFTLASGVIFNFHYKERPNGFFSFTPQNQTANQEQADMVLHFASALAEQE